MLLATAATAAPALEWAIPFALLLLTIAVLGAWPSHAVQHWWEKPWVKLVVSTPFIGVVAYWAFTTGNSAALNHEIQSWFSFVALIIPMMHVTYGIVTSFNVKATPVTNTLGLGMGAVLGSLIGTPGAVLLTSLALLKINRTRTRTLHVWIGIIFLVSNVGGMLLPSGPPLAIALQGTAEKPGIPFPWFATNLIVPWVLTLAWGLIFFYAIDSYQWRKEAQWDNDDVTPSDEPTIRGWLNVLLLGVMTGLNMAQLPFGQLEGGLIACAVASHFAPGGAQRRKANGFSWNPALEVGITFFGIFVCMAPVMQILGVRGGEIPISQPWQFYCVTGVLSGFLDNAPTLRCFLEVGCGVTGQPSNLALATNQTALAVATCMGAAFWGLLTYIGNGPNLVAKAVVENATDASGKKRTMPNFGLYMVYGLGGIAVLGVPNILYILLR